MRLPPALTDWKALPEGEEKRRAYYCSREWAARRDLIRARSGGVCERCGTREAEAVHHLTYLRLYDETPADLWHLCGACHDYIHNKSDVDPADVWPGEG